MGGFFLAPAEAYSLPLLRWDPLGPLLCFIAGKKFFWKNILGIIIFWQKRKLLAEKNSDEKISGEKKIWLLAGGSWQVVVSSQ